MMCPIRGASGGMQAIHETCSRPQDEVFVVLGNCKHAKFMFPCWTRKSPRPERIPGGQDGSAIIG